MTQVVENPLGYWCAPNGATPDYVATESIRDFVAWMFYRVQADWCHEVCRHKDYPAFIREVRQGILRGLADAMEYVHKHQEIDDLESAIETYVDLDKSVFNVVGVDDEVHINVRVVDTEDEYHRDELKLYMELDCLSTDAEVHNYEAGDGWLTVPVGNTGWYEDAKEELQAIAKEVGIAL